MIRAGECLLCLKLDRCRETSVDRVLSSFTCALFNPVHEAVYRARWDAMQMYGESSAVRGMLPLHHNEEEKQDG